MKTHDRVSVSKCCGYKTTYWQPPVREYVCNKCGETCELEGIDLQVYDTISRGHYRKKDNSKIGF